MGLFFGILLSIFVILLVIRVIIEIAIWLDTRKYWDRKVVSKRKYRKAWREPKNDGRR